MRSNLLWGVGLSLVLGACIGGQVTDRETRAALNGVTVRARGCPDCVQHTTVTARRAVNGDPDSMLDGHYEFNPYEDGPNVGSRNGYFASELIFERPGYNRLVKYFTPNYQSLRHASGEMRYAALYSPKLTRDADSDGDGLTDGEERDLGTDTADLDTDDDGVWDGWEVHGHDWVDYAALGAHPLRKDVFVEIDYQEWTDGGGVKHSARMSDALVSKIEQLYLNLDVTHPDGTRGIRVHIFQQGILPRGHNCNNSTDGHLFHTKHQRVFKYGQLCLAFSENDQMGSAGSTRFFGRALQVDRDTANDATELAQGVWLVIVAHELGHTLGLGHGGVDTINCKPNYPSLMNYVYMKAFLGTPLTIRDTAMQFSTGRLPTLDERAMNERNSFPGFSSTSLQFLRSYGSAGFAFNTHSLNPWVDWNRDLFYSAATTALDINGRGYVSLFTGTDACTEESSLQVLRDSNDGALIEANLRRLSMRTTSGALPIVSETQVTTCGF